MTFWRPLMFQILSFYYLLWFRNFVFFICRYNNPRHIKCHWASLWNIHQSCINWMYKKHIMCVCVCVFLCQHLSAPESLSRFQWHFMWELIWFHIAHCTTCFTWSQNHGNIKWGIGGGIYTHTHTHTHIHHVISGIHNEVDLNCALLGYYAVSCVRAQ